jgi:hypothetical protein
VKVGDLVKIKIFKGETTIKRALVLKVDVDLVKVVINCQDINNLITWLHKEHVKVISRGN